MRSSKNLHLLSQTLDTTSAWYDPEKLILLFHVYLMFLKLAPVVDSSKEGLSCMCVKCSEKLIGIISYRFFYLRTVQIFLLKGKLKTLHLID